MCDVEESRLQAAAEHFPQADRTGDYARVLARHDVDAVILATPAGLHAQHVTQAIDAGKHVFVEKPMALSVAEGRRLVEHAKAAGRTLMVGHTFLYNDAVRTLKQLLESGDLGRVYCVLAERMSLGKIREDVNAMWNLAPHDFSILLHLFGAMPRRVWAKGGIFLPGSTLHDVVIATLEFPGGALANVLSSWLNPLKIRRMTVVGDKKMVFYDDASPDEKIQIYDKSVDSEPYYDPSGSFEKFRRQIRSGEKSVPSFEFREPLGVEIAHFVECLREGRVPLTDGEEGLRVLRILEACQKSLESDGAPIEP
jgi:predicted dehydrogenase